MTTYAYSISYTTAAGAFERVICPTEEQMFALALECDRKGWDVREAQRLVWEEREGYARLVRTDTYRMGVPQVKEAQSLF